MGGSGGHFGGLPELLTFLGTSPTADQVTTQLVAGPGRAFRATLGSILVLEDDELRVIGRHGYAGNGTNSRFPLWADLPVSQAVREGTVISHDNHRAEDDFTDLAAAWRHAPELAGPRSMVCAPILARGRALGGFFLSCDSEPTWGSLEFALVSGAGRALALWLEHSGAAESMRQGPASEPPVALTERQRAIVRDLAAGRTLTAIAARLGCSMSTVKSDLQRAGRVLGADSRADLLARAGALGLLEPALADAVAEQP